MQVTVAFYKKANQGFVLKTHLYLEVKFLVFGNNYMTMDLDFVELGLMYLKR